MNRIATLLVLAFLTGCASNGGHGEMQPYYGPTEPVAQVIDRINKNNGRLPTLWASHYYEATIFDENKKSHFVNGDGAILYRGTQAERGPGMLVVGTKPAVGRVFEIGSTAEHYWLKILPELDTLWWGYYKNLGKPCVRKIPIQPNLVSEVLGVGLIATNFTEFPAPVMRFNNDADAYTFVWIVPAAGPARYVAQKEIWYDRKTFLPTLVILFDPDGRVVLRARLSKHQPIEVEDAPKDQWPSVATDYRLYFPETGSKMSFELNDVRLDKNGVPSRKGVAFPGATPEEAGVSKVIQLDQDCVDR